ncbi:hypothetical protein, partial [Myxococcus xanthus]|uniref:hypothetical protein n=1 Tax=Myxococcus xanthus TaxID=34 RepID=UPI001C10041E
YTKASLIQAVYVDFVKYLSLPPPCFPFVLSFLSFFLSCQTIVLLTQVAQLPCLPVSTTMFEPPCELYAKASLTPAVCVEFVKYLCAAPSFSPFFFLAFLFAFVFGLP